MNSSPSPTAPINRPVATDNRRAGLLRALRLRDGVALVTGTVIGSGIFLVPGAVALQLPSLRLVLLAWSVGGLLSLAGALSLGELAAAYPDAGGLYVYLSHTYGRPLGFLYGWGLLAMIQSGTISTLGRAFSLSAARLFGLGPLSQELAAISSILLFTLINCMGIRSGKLVQN